MTQSTNHPPTKSLHNSQLVAHRLQPVHSWQKGEDYVGVEWVYFSKMEWKSLVHVGGGGDGKTFFFLLVFRRVSILFIVSRRRRCRSSSSCHGELWSEFVKNFEINGMSSFSTCFDGRLELLPNNTWMMNWSKFLVFVLKLSQNTFSSLSRVCAVSTDKINEGRLFNLFVCKPGNRPTFDFVFAFNMDEFGSSRAFHERFTHFLHNVDKERV